MISDETLYNIYKEIGLPPLTEEASVELDADEVLAFEFAVAKKKRAMKHLREVLVQFDHVQAA